MQTRDPLPAHTASLGFLRRASRRLVAVALSVGALTAGFGSSMSSAGTAHADTPAAPICGVITAYTAPSTTDPGSFSIVPNGGSSATTMTIAAGASWSGLPPVVGDSLCVSTTVDATGTVTSGSATGDILTPLSGLSLTGPFVLAHADLVDAAGTFSGTVTLAEDAGTGLVYTSVTVFNPAVTAGLHGVSISSAGSCDASAFASAATPAAVLPDISTNDNGVGDLEAVSKTFSLSATTTPPVDAVGGSIVVSSAPGTGSTSATGSTLLCGVITAG